MRALSNFSLSFCILSSFPKAENRSSNILISSAFCFYMTFGQQPVDSLKRDQKFTGSDNPLKSRLDMFVDSLLSKYAKSPFTTGISLMVSCDGNDHFYDYGEISK